ncbi:MAG: hypothetical protein HYY03_09075 [Chloroflexi bacterium]|nr:hypothetical protein [Chloroflexota bacterium]
MTEALGASRAFLGVDADLWAAIAALVGPLIAVLSGLFVFRIQQQSEHASERFVTNGIQKLYGTLSTLLSIHLLNFQIGAFIVRTLKTYELGHPLAPRGDEIPTFLGLELESLPIDSLLPVQELVGDKVVLDWAMSALSDVTLEAKECDSEIRQPVAAYYRGNPTTTKLRRDEALRGLTIVQEAWNLRVSAHFALLDRLNDLARHIAVKRPWTVSGYYAVRDRREIGQLREQMHKGFEKAKLAREQTKPWLQFQPQSSQPTPPSPESPLDPT